MEIDFLGLNSTTKFDNMEKRDSKDAIFPVETGGVETSLSLRPSLSCQSESVSEKEKWAQFCSSSGSSGSTVCSLTEKPSLHLIPTSAFCVSASTTAAGFLYNLDDKMTQLRKIPDIPAEPASLTMLYPTAACANVLNNNLPEKAESSKYTAGKNSNGYTPTVAMARRATLARFLEQRSHRMKKARTTHFTGSVLKR